MQVKMVEEMKRNRKKNRLNVQRRNRGREFNKLLCTVYIKFFLNDMSLTSQQKTNYFFLNLHFIQNEKKEKKSRMFYFYSSTVYRNWLISWSVSRITDRFEYFIKSCVCTWHTFQ